MSVSPKVLGPAVLAAVVVLAVVILAGGGDKPYVVKAVYADASGLTKDYDVKIDGVPAGTIKKVELDDHDRAVLTLELDKGAAPIGAGARAYARPANLLGEKYIDLRLGDRSRPAPSGTVIPVQRTGAPVELDDVLNTLDAGTRARLRILINEAGTSLAGRGADFNALLRALPNALDDTRRVVSDVNSENARLRRTISAADRIAASVAGRSDDLQRVVGDASSALDAVAERRRSLGAAVQAAPSALSQLNGTLAELDRTAGDLVPASRALRQAAPPLREVLAALPAFTDQAQDTLGEAERTAQPLSRLATQATPDVKRLATTVQKAGAFAQDLAPVVRGLDRGVLRDAIGLMHGWGRVIARSDGLGHIFRVRVNVDQELLTSALSHYTGALKKPAGPATRKKTAPKPSAAPEPQADAPATPTKSAPAPAAPLPAVAEVVTKVGDAVKQILDPVLGALAPGAGRGGAPPPPSSGGNDALRLFDYLLGN